MAAFTDPLVLYGHSFSSRLLLGSAQYPSPVVLNAAISQAQPAMVTTALRRQGAINHEDGRAFWRLLTQTKRPILPNTAGCFAIDEAITTAEMAREVFETPWLKLEIIGHEPSLHPDMEKLITAANTLIKRGFYVLPYCTDDLVACQRLLDAGCQALMPWAAPIGTGMGPMNPYGLQMLRQHLSTTPLIIDAGIGRPSHVCQVMEWGYDGVLINTAIAQSGDPATMASAFHHGIIAGRAAYLAKTVPERPHATASTPTVGQPFFW